jgi:hypothetical protein
MWRPEVGDDDPVFHLVDARYRPRHSIGFVGLEPGVHGATQNNFTAVGSLQVPPRVLIAIIFDTQRVVCAL